MVKITADLIARAPVVYTPLGDRELRLRGLKIPAIRNLGSRLWMPITRSRN